MLKGYKKKSPRFKKSAMRPQKFKKFAKRSHQKIIKLRMRL